MPHQADLAIDHHASVREGDVFDDPAVLRQISNLGSDITALFERTGEVEACAISGDRFHGLESDELLADKFMERLHITDRPAFLGALSSAFYNHQRMRLEVRLRCRREDQAADFFCWIELDISGLEPDDTRPDAKPGAEARQSPRLLCAARDISTRKEREQQLLADEGAAREMVDSQSRSLTNISHALRTPLNAIIGFSEMMKQVGLKPHNEQTMLEYAGIIHDSGRHLLGVVDEVFYMSQCDAGRYRLDPQVFSVADLVAASLELVQSEAQERHVRVIIADFDKKLQMNADLLACKQVLVLLLASKIQMLREDHLTLAITAHHGEVEFAVSGAGQDGSGTEQGADVPASRPAGGTRLRAFVDLLGGDLSSGGVGPGQSMAIVKLPAGLCVEEARCNIVSIDALPVEDGATLRQSA